MNLSHLLARQLSSGMSCLSIWVEHTCLCTNRPSAIRIEVFRVVLNRGRFKITCPHYALEPILEPLFASAVYGVSLTYCKSLQCGVTRR